MLLNKKYFLLTILLSSVLNIFCAHSYEPKELTAKQYEQQCSICWDNIKANEQKRQLSCNHMFHLSCISSWFNEPISQAKCPICKNIDKIQNKEIINQEIRDMDLQERREMRSFKIKLFLICAIIFGMGTYMPYLYKCLFILKGDFDKVNIEGHWFFPSDISTIIHLKNQCSWGIRDITTYSIPQCNLQN